MKIATRYAKARAVYAILFLVSIPIPLLHYQFLGDALWAVRYPWGLHPVLVLCLWGLGRDSVALPIAILAVLSASWVWPRLCSPAVLIGVAFVGWTFTAFYAYCCGVALFFALQR